MGLDWLEALRMFCMAVLILVIAEVALSTPKEDTGDYDA